MNRENVLKVADAIEQHSIPDLGFNMATFRDIARDAEPDNYGAGCGTVACIAGWAEAVRLGTGVFVNDGLTDERSADYLELTSEQSGPLFFGYGMSWSEFTAITPKQAVAVLRHLAETGEVDWTVADKVAA